MGRRGLMLCGVSAVALSLSCAVRDEAKRAGVTAQQLIPKAVEPVDDYFRDMDYNRAHGTNAPPLSRDEIAGRAMWMVWTGGNDRLWDRLTIDSIGTFDLLKIISSHPRTSAGRRVWE